MNNVKRLVRGTTCALLIGGALAIAGCASPRGGYYGGDNGDYRGASYTCQRCGRVDSIREVYTDGGNDSAALGTVIGAVVGAVAGHQVGKGDGRKAATVGGAVAGGVIGHEIGQRRGGERAAWQVRVRLDNGRIATVTQREQPNARIGDYVEVRDNRVYLRR